MRLLVIGATGLLGRRIIAAAAAHDDIEVFAYVRSPAKLEAVLPPSAHPSVKVVEGDGGDTATLKTLLAEHRIDALVASVNAPDGQPECVTEVYRPSIRLVAGLPSDQIKWSMLCPGLISPGKDRQPIDTRVFSNATFATDTPNMTAASASFVRLLWATRANMLGCTWMALVSTAASADNIAIRLVQDLGRPFDSYRTSGGDTQFIGKKVTIRTLWWGSDKVAAHSQRASTSASLD